MRNGSPVLRRPVVRGSATPREIPRLAARQVSAAEAHSCARAALEVPSTRSESRHAACVMVFIRAQGMRELPLCHAAAVCGETKANPHTRMSGYVAAAQQIRPVRVLRTQSVSRDFVGVTRGST